MPNVASLTILGPAPAFQVTGAILSHLVKNHHLVSSMKNPKMVLISILSAIEPVVADDPCDPNPCGDNALPPRQIGDRCQCSCLPEMIGSPPNCRPECVVNSDCPSALACINRKCQDPCPGLCGQNAYCRVRNHVPICVCNQGYIGDPFSSCYLKPSKTIRLLFWVNIYFNNIRHCTASRGCRAV